MDTHLFQLDPHHCFFQFSSFLNCSTIYHFWQFRVLNFRSHFEALNDVFSTSNGQTNMSPFRTQNLSFMDVFIEYIFLKVYHVHQMKVVCQSYNPRKFRCTKLPNGAHILEFHLLGLGFWMCRVSIVSQ